MEVFEKEQLERNTGGPKSPNLLYSLEEIFTDFQDLQMLTFSKEIIRLQEGKLHDGEAVVIRYVGKKND
ncbi:MAG: hypothetical protein K9J16_17905 [Melioribacteraceae bacterium]|nr:hypothetical protein [Melioribacteraceae bacterium]MCF8356718.1 hypothetical protein [Melioribacteraceae bacterium]MCF8396102.1 hypothetical protein [Melioribacteraceae bacterium]MCF8421088.1 hypothetical protein [Melioribacteraceae bacterium]